MAQKFLEFEGPVVSYATGFFVYGVRRQSEEATALFFWYAKFSNEIQSAVALRSAGALQFWL